MKHEFKRDKIQYSSRLARERADHVTEEKARVESKKIRELLGIKHNRYERKPNTGAVIGIDAAYGTDCREGKCEF